jgi:deoxyribodipyrimidine photolyase-related protein
MGALRLILGDQLSHSIPSLEGLKIAQDTVMLCEVMEEASYVPHHPKKIAFLFSAMRHFAAELEAKGCLVRYVKLDDPENSRSFTAEVKRAVAALKPDRVEVTEPGEYRVLLMIRSWQALLGIPVVIRSDTRFLADHDDFAAWAKDKKQLRMEFFYREMRKKHKILMEQDGKPTGGVWNYDRDNRKPPIESLKSPRRLGHKNSAITKEVLALVRDRFSHHFGRLEPFHYAVTRNQALKELDHFVTHVLADFGDYQDAMLTGEPYLYHSLLATYLNAGLLLPLEICKRAELAYRHGQAPLNAVEGFIRQILGWREYIRGIYWHSMPDYGARNTLNATRPLPQFYWTAETKMFCMSEAISHTRDHAYSHHIQRLMITGNFALLAGLDVKAVQDWYLAVYSDAYEWVEMPNTLGMALFGDGGVVASKPYAASGKYIDRMSTYCSTCAYDPEEMTGDKACPFNALYWDFMARHENNLRGNQRLPYVFSTWEKFNPEKQKAILAQASRTLEKMAEGTL